jgi:probable HAF family extracellular repeat protein
MQDLGELPGADDYSFAWGINDFGSVVGESRAVTIAGFLWSHAFLWTSAGGIQDLGTFDSTSDNVSTAYGINSIGQIVGFSTGNGYHALAWHAFLWTSDAPNGTSGSMIDLGVLPGEGFSEAHAINTAGHVVGDSSLRPFLWTPADGMLELSTLLDSSGAGWNLDRAMSINDANQIVGWGTNPSGATHAFLLTPVPEPGTGVLAVCGAFGVRLVVRRRATAAKRRGRTAWHFSTRIDGQ